MQMKMTIVESNKQHISVSLDSSSAQEDVSEGVAKVNLMSTDSARRMYTEIQNQKLLQRVSTLRGTIMDDSEFTDLLSATMQGQ